MSKVKLPLNGTPDIELLAMGRKHLNAMENNPHFPDPVPDAAAFAAATEKWESQIQDVRSALTAYKAALAAKNAGRAAYMAVLRQRASHVEAVSGGKEVQIVSAGFGLRKEGSRVGTLPAPEEFLATMGDRHGRIRLRWKRVRGARAYQAEYQRRDESQTGNWKPITPSTAAKLIVDDLESGVEYVFRVAAIGTAGPSPWSDLSFMMAP